MWSMLEGGTEISEPEAGVVDGESICSGKVLVQSIHPRPITLSAGDLHLKNMQYTQQNLKTRPCF